MNTNILMLIVPICLAISSCDDSDRNNRDAKIGKSLARVQRPIDSTIWVMDITLTRNEIASLYSDTDRVYPTDHIQVPKPVNVRLGVFSGDSTKDTIVTFHNDN